MPASSRKRLGTNVVYVTGRDFPTAKELTKELTEEQFTRPIDRLAALLPKSDRDTIVLVTPCVPDQPHLTMIHAGSPWLDNYTIVGIPFRPTALASIKEYLSISGPVRLASHAPFEPSATDTVFRAPQAQEPQEPQKPQSDTKGDTKGDTEDAGAEPSEFEPSTRSKPPRTAKREREWTHTMCTPPPPESTRARTSS